jgi:phosphoglycolate phosphatase-like HAD superfamily hydrolase
MRTILFDLDGTLLPMNQNVFVNDYFRRMAAYCAPYGFDSERLVKDIWKGTAAMVANDGTMTNE